MVLQRYQLFVHALYLYSLCNENTHVSLLTSNIINFNLSYCSLLKVHCIIPMEMNKRWNKTILLHCINQLINQ